MPRNPSKPENNFGVLINVVGADGKVNYGSDGKILKKKVRMKNGKLNGQEQEFYYPEGHPKAGLFKGMAEILTERGHDVSKKRAQCGKGFGDCPEVQECINNCCCRRILFNEPDFIEEESLLETCCRSRSYAVHFFPKFHCEISFIEQCWGNAKQRYHLLPPTSKEIDLEQNVVACLDNVPLITMQQ